MIDDEKKEELLKEISKVGIVYSSCMTSGVNKATYYRWKKRNKKFRKLANEAEKNGSENISDIAEHGLIKNIRKGDQRAIEFALSRRSKKYKQKKQTSNVVIMHKKDFPLPVTQKTLEELLDEDEGLLNRKSNQRLEEEKGTEIRLEDPKDDTKR